MGFSQGGALSLHTGMQLPPGWGRLGGIIVMSGYLPHSSGFAISPGLESMPVFYGHGKSDPLVRPDTARESCNVAVARIECPKANETKVVVIKTILNSCELCSS